MLLHVYSADGSSLRNTSREDALAAGFSEEEITAGETQVRQAEASQECRRRIYSIAPAETQMNMAAASAIISSKTSSSRTDEEKAILAGLEAAIGWVSAMRAAVKTLSGDPSKDFKADEHWPDVPAAAAAIAGQF
tara:strand:- start:560 stop:964 length:405 start_codon:yes stop_codon:yes gene_type:complete